ncbi:MAG: diacylglycerol kinase [Acidimicrobiaceae bacterium]|nr:diacylglycerol kinase [Acidimicrobiaceae bacterium]
MLPGQPGRESVSHTRQRSWVEVCPDRARTGPARTADFAQVVCHAPDFNDGDHRPNWGLWSVAMRLLLVVNPSASSVTARTRIVIQKALSADHRLEVAATSRRGHATRLAQGAANDGIDVVAVLGGDGTLNEAANGLVGTDTALAALPGGSTNVFARTLGLPDDPVEATGALLDAIEAASIRRIGLGSVNGRHFLFHAGIGFDAAVVEQVERRGGLLKRFAGHPLFVAASVDTWIRHYDHRQPAFHVAIGGDESVVFPSVFTVCLNTDPYTYLGTRRLSLAPAASLDRPLSIVSFRDLRPGTVAASLMKAAGLGANIGRLSSVATIDDVDAADVAASRPVPWQVDGDHVGEAIELSVRHHPAAMDLVIPLASPAID